MSEKAEERGHWEAPKWLRAAMLTVLGVAVVGALALTFRPQPVSVDLVEVEFGTVEVVVEEDGRTRVRDRFEVTAPVSGTLRRVELRPGDAVAEGDELVQIRGPEAAVPDARTRQQLLARMDAAEAAVERARAMVDLAEAGLVEARDEVRRQEVLMDIGAGTQSGLDRARAALAAREAELRSAQFAVRGAEGEVEDLRLALSRPTGAGEELALRSPVVGVVLRVHRESGGAVSAGEPLLEVGDPRRLEVVVDLLSADAVRVPVGAEASIEAWGGDEELHARVRRVEPAGFTRISALGIEEQRVNVILDPLGDAEVWGRLGDGFRVEARILLDRAENVLRVPAGALFRDGDGWAVFRVEGGRLAEVPVEVGRRSQTEAEVVSGLESGDRVVVYPGDQVEDGVRFEER